MASYMRMRTLLTNSSFLYNSPHNLILKRRLQQPELSTVRLYLQQLYTVLEKPVSLVQGAPSQQQPVSQQHAVIDYLDKLFTIFNKSIHVNGISPDLTLETWRYYFSTIHKNDIDLLLNSINQHENYNQIHKYLEDNEKDLEQMYSHKQLTRLFQMMAHLDNLNLRKTTLRLYDYYLDGDLERYDLYDIMRLQNAYTATNHQMEFKSQTADSVRYKLFKNVNPEPDRENYLLRENVNNRKHVDFDYTMDVADMSNDYLWLKTKLMYKYTRFFTSDVQRDAKEFFEMAIGNLEKNKLKNDFYYINIVSNLFGVNRLMRRQFDFNSSQMLIEHISRNKQYLFQYFDLMINKYNLLYILIDLHKQRQLTLEDIDLFLQRLNRHLLENDVKTLKVQNFLSISSVYDYLLYVKSILLSREYNQVPLGDDNIFSSSLIMNEYASYNHSSHESNTNFHANKSYFTYLNLIRTIKEENPNLCHQISNFYNYLISSTYTYSFYPLSKSITFILNVHTRQDLALRLLHNLLAHSTDQITQNQKLSSLLLSAIVLCNNYKTHVNKWPLMLHLKEFLVKRSYMLDIQTKTSILNYMLNSPSTLLEVFNDIHPIITEIVQTRQLENCFVILRGISSNIKSLVENHPGLINRLGNTIYQRICMQMMLPLVDLYDEQAVKMRAELVKDANYSDRSEIDRMVKNELLTDRVKYYRIQRTYIYLIFMFKKLQRYPSFLDLNYIFKYVEHIDFAHLVRFFHDYVCKIEASKRDDVEQHVKTNDNLINYNIDKVLQKLCWLVNLQYDQSYYNAHQLDILWSFLIYFLDFTLKNEQLVRTKTSIAIRNHVVITLAKIFSRYNYLNSNNYKMQSNLLSKLLDEYFSKYKHAFMFNELVSFGNSLVALDLHSHDMFSHVYNQKIIVDNTQSQDEREIRVNGEELHNKISRIYCDGLMKLTQHLCIKYKDLGSYRFINLIDYSYRHDFQYDQISFEKLRNILIKVLGVSCINFNPTYPYKLFANCELALNEKHQFIDPRSVYAKIRIPILFIDESMCYVNKQEPNRDVEMLIEMFKLQNYPILTINLKEFENTKESKYEFVNNKLLDILREINK